MIVEGPNGVRIEFPDGTPPEIVDRVMREASSGGAATPTPQQPQLGPESLTPGAFSNARFMPDTAGDPNLNASLRVAADMVRMGQPGGGSIYPGPGPQPPRGGPATAQAAAPSASAPSITTPTQDRLDVNGPVPPQATTLDPSQPISWGPLIAGAPSATQNGQPFVLTRNGWLPANSNEAQQEIAARTGQAAAWREGGRDTLSLGFWDEMQGLMGGDTEAARLYQQRMREEYPGAYTTGQLAGAVPYMALPAGPLAGAPGAVPRVAGAALGAGAPMAAYGVGSGTTTGERVGGGLAMGALGTGLALAAPIVGGAVGKVAGGVIRRFLPGGRTTAASKAVSEAFEADQGTPAGVTQLGPEGMIADTGPNTQQLAAALAAVPGAAQRTVRGALTTRASGAGSRVRTDMSGAMPSQNIPQTLEALNTARSQTAAPLYAQAYATPINGQAPAFLSVLGTPAGQAAWRQASRLAANEGAQISKTNLTTRAIDYVKRALDDQISAARRAGQNEQVRALEGLRTRLLKEIDVQNPTYRQARAAYAGPSALIDSMEAGQSVFARTMSPDQLRVELGRMSPSERDAFLVGARAQIEQMMGTARNDASAAIRELIEKGWNAEKLRLLLGRQGASQIIRALQRERTFAQTTAAVTTNSETARRLSGIGQLDKAANSIRAAYQNGGMMAVLRAGGVSAVEKFLRGLSGEQAERLSADIARQLTAQGPERDAVLQALMQIRQNNATVGRVRSAVDQIIQKAVQSGALGTEGQTVGPATGVGQWIGNTALEIVN